MAQPDFEQSSAHQKVYDDTEEDPAAEDDSSDPIDNDDDDSEYEFLDDGDMPIETEAPGQTPFLQLDMGGLVDNRN